MKGNTISSRLAYTLGISAFVIAILKGIADRQLGWLQSSNNFAPVMDYFLFPLIFVTLVFSLFIRPLLNRRILRAARRNDFFTCPMCSYDLSATPNFTACPECGLKGNHETFTRIWTSHRSHAPHNQLP